MTVQDLARRASIAASPVALGAVPSDCLNVPELVFATLILPKKLSILVSDRFVLAKAFVKSGGKIEAIKKKYKVTPEIEKELKTL